MPVGATEIYRIKQGDSIWSISENKKTSLKEIQTMNPQIKNPEHIIPGQLLVLPISLWNK